MALSGPLNPGRPRCLSFASSMPPRGCPFSSFAVKLAGDATPSALSVNPSRPGNSSFFSSVPPRWHLIYSFAGLCLQEAIWPVMFELRAWREIPISSCLSSVRVSCVCEGSGWLQSPLSIVKSPYILLHFVFLFIHYATFVFIVQVNYNSLEQ